MITKIEINELYKDEERGIKKPFTMIPKPTVNVFVGENGCGKSSLIWFIKNNKDSEAINIEIEDNNQCLFFDSEMDNPKTKDVRLFDSYAYALNSHFTSHGETMFPILKHIVSQKNKLIFLDEPENGLSLKNQLKLWRALNKAVKNGCQIFIATHSYVFIKKFKYVFDLEKKFEFIKSEEWLKQYKI